MKNEPSLASLKPVVDILKRFNLTIFLVAIVGMLIFAVILLNDIVAKASLVSLGGTTGPTSTPALFDNETISRINKLNSSTENSPPNASGARTDPFR